MTKQISLCGVPYEITEQDGQVIFEEKSGFAGSYSRFTAEWTGLGWYLIDMDSRHDKVYLPHIVAAAEWLKENYAVTWTGGLGTVKLR